MRCLIVHAHHEPQSFNGTLTHRAIATLGDLGHEVLVSDLHAMGFDPASDRRNFTTVKDADDLKQQREEMHATERSGRASAPRGRSSPVSDGDRRRAAVLRVVPAYPGGGDRSVHLRPNEHRAAPEGTARCRGCGMSIRAADQPGQGP